MCLKGQIFYSNQAVGGGQLAVASHPLDCNREYILIATMANVKTRSFEIARYFDFITSLKTLTHTEYGGGGGGVGTKMV